MKLPLNQILCGDCAELLQGFPDNSIDLVVTDPPYGLGFMGKKWDRALPSQESFKQIIRVLKPGALAFVMSSPRQDLMWRMMQLIESVGFELRQSFISWIYKTGFPKAYDVSKGIDQRNTRTQEDHIKLGKYLKEKRIKKGLTTIALGEYFKTHPDRINHGGCVTNWEKGYNVPTYKQWKILKNILCLNNNFDWLIERIEAKRKKTGKSDSGMSWGIFNPLHKGGYSKEFDLTDPSLSEARAWDGWKSQTGLKPALEPILMVNKPFSESTIVDNVLKWGTGAINVDATRIPFKDENDKEGSKVGYTYFGARSSLELSNHEDYPKEEYNSSKGRFPANLLVSDGALDTGEQSKSGTLEPHHIINGDGEGHKSGKVYGSFTKVEAKDHTTYGDAGDQSRYFDLDAWAQHQGFLDVPKPDTSERDYGLKGRNTHPTVKPIKLMAFLIELGCPRNGVVLDPFLGSGTTCIAAKQLGRRYIGIEINPEDHAMAMARVAAYPQPLEWFQEAEP